MARSNQRARYRRRTHIACCQGIGTFSSRPALVHHFAQRSQDRDKYSQRVLTFLPVFRRTAMPRKISRGVDHPKVRKRLGKIPHQPARRRIVAFRQETDVVANIKEALKNFTRFVVPALKRKVIGQPKEPGKESALPRRQAVDFGIRVISRDKSILHEMTLNRAYG